MSVVENEFVIIEYVNEPKGIETYLTLRRSDIGDITILPFIGKEAEDAEPTRMATGITIVTKSRTHAIMIGLKKEDDEDYTPNAMVDMKNVIARFKRLPMISEPTILTIPNSLWLEYDWGTPDGKPKAPMQGMPGVN